MTLNFLFLKTQIFNNFFTSSLTIFLLTVLVIFLVLKTKNLWSKSPNRALAVLFVVMAIGSYNLPQKYQLLNLWETNRLNSKTQVAGEENQTPNPPQPTISPETKLLYAPQSAYTRNLYEVLASNQDRKNLILGSMLLTPHGELFIVTGSVVSDSIKRHTIKSINLATNSIDSRTIKDQAVKSEDLSRNLEIEHLTIKNELTVADAVNSESLNTENIDLGTNTITDQNFTGDWNFNAGNLENIATLSSGPITATSDSTTNLSKTLNISHNGSVSGTGYAGYFSKTGSSTTNVGLYATATGATSNYALQIDSDTIGANNYTIYANGIAKNYFAGNVGIGTTNPTARLTIKGSGNDGTTMALQINNSDGVSLLTALNDGNIGIGSTAPSARLQVVGTDSSNTSFAANIAGATGTGLIVKNSGNVGIGTTSPGATLHVKSVSLNPMVVFEGTSAISPSIAIWDGNATQNKWRIGSGWAAQTDGKFFITDDQSGGLRFLIDKSGNVGIGDVAPGTKLSVKGASPTSRIWDTAGTNHAILQFTAGDVNQIDSNGELLSTAPLAFLMGGLEKVRITTTGNVGIGTTGPDAKLYVAGNLMVGKTNKIAFNYDPGNTNLYNYIAWDTGGTEALTIAGGLWTSSATQQAINFKTQGVAAAVSILNNGNVGIGTTGPGTGKLAINVDGTSVLKIRSSIDLANSVALWAVNDAEGSNKPMEFRASNYLFTNVGTNFNIIGGNVGIGTTGPGYSLEVAGSGAFSGSVAQLSFVRTGAITSSHTLIPGAGGANNRFGLYSNVASSYSWFVGSDQTFVIPSGELTVSGTGNSSIAGNVGIGTTAPLAKLHVNQISASNTRELIAKYGISDGGNSAFLFSNGTENDNIFNPQMAGFTDQATAALSITGVVMNTADSGTAPIMNFNAMLTSSAADPLNGTLTSPVTRNLFHWQSGGNVYMVMKSGGNVGIGSTGPTARLQVIGVDDLSTSFAAKLGGATTTGLIITNAGNVGIGTTGPGFKLHTVSATDAVATFSSSATGNTGNIRIYNGSNYNYGVMGVVSGTGASGGDVYSLGYSSDATGTYTSVLKWKSDRSVEVIDTNNTGGYISWGGSVARGALSYNTAGPVLVGATSNHDLTLIANSSEKVRITTSGNVGIGTTGPSEKLHIFGTSATSMAIQNTNTASLKGIYLTESGAGNDIAAFQLLGSAQTDEGKTGWARFRVAGGGAYPGGFIIGTGNVIPVEFMTDDTTRMTISGSGNVGIGTTAPGAKLEISGTADNPLRLRKTTGGWNYIEFYNNTARQGYFGMDNSNNFMFAPELGGNTIINSGNIGIGTTSPTQKLTVAGNINVVGGSFIDDGTTLSVPDYVFEPGYDLRTIPELEIFLAQNSHLPGVSSREQVKKNGMNYGSMMMALLEKTEENTLYTISNFKDIQENKTQIAQISDQFAMLNVAFHITIASETANLSQNRDIEASQNRDIAISANAINLTGNVFANGLDLNSAITGITENQNKIVEQLTGQLDTTSLTVSERVNIIGKNLDDLTDNQIKKIKQQIEDTAGNQSLLDARLGILETVLGVNGSNLSILGDISANNLSLSGKLDVDSAVSGAFAVKVVSGKPKTIGEAYICPADDTAEKCADSIEGKLVKVETTAISTSAKIFINFENNPRAYSWTEKDVTGGKFTINLDKAVTEPVKVNWWILEEQ